MARMALTGGEQGDQGRQEDERTHGGRLKAWLTEGRANWWVDGGGERAEKQYVV